MLNMLCVALQLRLIYDVREQLIQEDLENFNHILIYLPWQAHPHTALLNILWSHKVKAIRLIIFLYQLKEHLSILRSSETLTHCLQTFRLQRKFNKCLIKDEIDNLILVYVLCNMHRRLNQ